MEQEIRDIMDRFGFELLGVERHPTTRKKMIRYRCVCGEESSTYMSNLKRPDRKARCPKCQNKKLDHDIIASDFELRGCVLLTPREEYQNNKQNLRYRCSCGAEAEIRYQDLLRGRLCPSCRNDRRIATKTERYGQN